MAVAVLLTRCVGTRWTRKWISNRCRLLGLERTVDFRRFRK